MDPKTLANLDPKLRETYERVMGSSTTSAPAPAAPAASSVPPPPVNPPIATAVSFVNDTPPASKDPKPDTPKSEDNSKSSSIPAPQSSAVPATPIPPPVSAPIDIAAQSQAPQPTPAVSVNTFPANPAPIPEITLQSSLMGVPLKDSKSSESQPGKPLQPLPSPSSINQQVPVAPAAAGPSTFIRVLYIFAGVIFFIVYAIFWLKIFHYPLPF